jgi:pilus assembly protein CpaE
VRHGSGPWLLAAPHSPDEAAAVTGAAATRIIAGLRTSHEQIVVDVPPSYGELALSAYEAAERIVVISSPEITSLRRTRDLLGVLERIGVAEERVLLVLNNLFEKSAIDRDRAEGFLRRPVNVVIPHGGRAFLEAVSGGRPVVTSQKGRAVDAIAELAALL